MHFGLFFFLIIGIVMWAIIKGTKFEENGSKKENHKEEDYVEEKDNNEMNTIFIEKVRGGSNTYKLLNIFNQFDLMFNKSLFQSEGIPYFTEGEHLSKIRPGIPIGVFGRTGIYIIEEDYDDAIEIIERYINNKKKNYYEKDSLRKPMEVLFGGGFVAPEANDLDGIEIIKKK